MIIGTGMKYLTCISHLARTLFRMLTLQIIIPLIIQPLLIGFISFFVPENIFLISLTLAIFLGISIQITKTELRSKFLFYWTVISISYMIIVFEVVVIPLAEIMPWENSNLFLFTFLSILFLFLTTTNTSKTINNSSWESTGSPLGKDMCPACRIKMEPGNYHCSICQECASLYDHHCYWLNCCIGDSNIHLYLTGIVFGIIALVYGALLIVTTVCSPDYYLGILLPQDCSEVCLDAESCTCLVCGIYSLELAGILCVKAIHHIWLISRGVSTFEWREKLRQNSLKPRSYMSEFIRNWIQFFLKFKKIHFKL